MENLMNFKLYELIILGITILLFIIHFLYCIVFYNRPNRWIKKKKTDSFDKEVVLPPVSVIVYAKNESVNLKKHLPILLTQNHAEYEVIVINDGSTDESENVLEELKAKYYHLYHTFIPQESRYLSRKKLAITMGIKAAKNETLLFIEANCFPSSPDWITSMVQNYASEKTKIVLGFCAYKGWGSFFHQLVSYDNLISGIKYISKAIVNKPYTGWGKNLSYKKELFFDQKGFSQSLSLHAGDDDLFINQTATGENTKVEYSPDSITEMIPYDRFAVWKESKISRAATEKHYKKYTLLPFRVENFLFYLFLLSILVSVVMGLIGNIVLTATALLLYILYYIIKGNVLRKAANLLQQKPVYLWMPFFDILLPVFGWYVKVYRIFRGKNDYTFSLNRRK